MTLDETLGFELVTLEDEAAYARFNVGDRHRQPFGVVHGASRSTFFFVLRKDR